MSKNLSKRKIFKTKRFILIDKIKEIRGKKKQMIAPFL